MSLACSGALAIEIEFVEADGFTFAIEDKQLIRDIATQTERDVRKVLPQLPQSLYLRTRNSKDVIAETGASAQASPPGQISWSVDASRTEGVSAIVRAHLRVTLFHEMHHLARGAVTSVVRTDAPIVDRAITEGMATAFARDFAKAPPLPWAQYPAEVGTWVEEFIALPPNAHIGRWMFNHEDGRRWIGYRVGLYLVDQAIRGSGKTSAELVGASSAQIIELAGYRPVSDAP
jgi:uncharacterized protein YjaZ